MIRSVNGGKFGDHLARMGTTFSVYPTELKVLKYEIKGINAPWKLRFVDVQTSRIIRLLKILSSAELNRLGKYLRSPFFNQSEPPRKLYQVLRRHHPDFTHPLLTPERLWRQVHADKPFGEQQFWRLCSNLAKLTEGFLVQLELDSNNRRRAQLLTDNLARRSDYDLYESVVRRREKLLDAVVLRDEKWFRERFELNAAHLNNPRRFRLDPKDRLAVDTLDLLDQSFALEKMRTGILFISRQRIFPIEYTVELMDWAMNLELLKGSFYFQLLSATVDLLSDTDRLEDLKVLILSNVEFLEKSEQQFFFYNGLNFAMRRMNRGEVHFEKTIFAWYKFADRLSILIRNDRISHNTVFNATSSALKNGKPEWARSFLQRMIAYVDPEYQRDLKNLTEGRLNHLDGNISDAILYLSQVSKKGIWMHLLARVLIAEYSFEMFLIHPGEEFDLLQTRLESFKVYLYREKRLQRNQVIARINLINLIKRTSTKIIQGGSFAEARKEIVAYLMLGEPLASKQWVLDTFMIGDAELNPISPTKQ